jgi:hypothetical protein
MNRRHAFTQDEIEEMLDGAAAKRTNAPFAGSVEPMARADYRAKRHPRPARVRYQRRADKRVFAEAAE